MRLLPICALIVVAALASACAGPAATLTQPPVPVTWVEVTLTDAMTIEPNPITVPAGLAVTFVVTNTGQIEHEFMLGDEAAQAEHATTPRG